MAKIYIYILKNKFMLNLPEESRLRMVENFQLDFYFSININSSCSNVIDSKMKR